MQTVWLNGRCLPMNEAHISPLDRGFLFADAVYEVVPVYAGRPFLFAEHMARLTRSLAAIGMSMPMSPEQFASAMQELVTRNGGGDLYIYLHVSRGADVIRNHAATPGLKPTVFMMTSPLAALDPRIPDQGVAAITTDDQRWHRCDIKSTALLPNILAKTRAVDAGATEAILIADGWLREGSSSSVLIVTAGVIKAPPYGPEILPGTTRDLLCRLAEAAGIPVTIAPVSVQELHAADEVLLGFATRGVLPVTRLDDHAVGSGRPGPVWRQLFEAFERQKPTDAHIASASP
jgi:D-alanine transaminase